VIPAVANKLQGAILWALQSPKKHVYGGTVPPAVVAKRRAKDKAASAARRVMRRSR
jgi:hypothetical protein